MKWNPPCTQRNHLSISCLNKFYPKRRNYVNDTPVNEVWLSNNENSFKKEDYFADEVIGHKYFTLQINFLHKIHTTPHEVFPGLEASAEVIL